MSTQEKQYYTEKELQEFKELILEKLKRAEDKLSSYSEQLTDYLSDFRIRSTEDCTDSAEAQVIGEMISREEKLIMHLNNALLRIQNKVYGICRSTGKLIPRERLLAVPHATLSIEAKINGK